MVGAPRGRHDHRRLKSGFCRLDDQMNGLCFRRAGCCRFHLPAHRVAKQYVTDDLARLQFDVANLQWRTDDRGLDLAEEKDHFPVGPAGDDSLALLPLLGQFRATDLVAVQVLGRRRKSCRQHQAARQQYGSGEFVQHHTLVLTRTHSCAVQSKSFR